MVAGSGACSHSAASPLGLECPRPVHPPPQPASARPPTRRLISSPLGTRCRPSQPPTARRARPAAACQTLNRGLAGTWPARGGEHEGRQPVRCGEGGAVCVGVGGWGPVGGGGGRRRRGRRQPAGTCPTRCQGLPTNHALLPRMCLLPHTPLPCAATYERGSPARPARWEPAALAQRQCRTLPPRPAGMRKGPSAARAWGRCACASAGAHVAISPATTLLQ